MFQIDDRAGSNKLAEAFDPGECELTRLKAGDIAFFGNGPNNDTWYIGIEYKTINDVVACIKSGRFTGTQLPGMFDLYDVCFLLIEGIARPDQRTGQLMRYAGKSNSFSLGLSYVAYDNFLTSVAFFSSLYGKPCLVKTSANMRESMQIIRNINAFFEKQWEEHVSMKKPDLTKIQNVTFDFSLLAEPEPGSPDYPQHVLRKAVFQIDGVGWKVAANIAKQFGTVETMMTATVKDLVAIDKVGNVLAKRLFSAFHGRQEDLKVRKNNGTI